MHLVTTAVLALAIVFCGCRSRAPEHVEIDVALSALVPHDTVAIAGLRMAAVRETPTYKKLVERGWSDVFNRFAKETDFDAKKDLSELLICSNGKDTVALAKGRFSPASLEAKLERPGTNKTTYKGYTLIGSDQAGVAFLKDDIAAAGPMTALRATIDRKERSEGGIPAKLLDRINSIPPDNQIWAVTTGTGPVVENAIPDSGNLANLKRVLASVDSAVLAIDLRSGLNVDANADCRTDQDAKFMHDSFRGLIGMARLTTPDNEPELLRFYDSISIVQNDKAVKLQVRVPMDVLQKFMDRAGNKL